MRGRLVGWRPALRIARRDALRARGRSALIVAMVALPILALTATDVLARSAQLDPEERVARALGQTQARLQASWSSGPVLQAPNPDDGVAEHAQASTDDAASRSAGSNPVDPRELAPRGLRVLTSQQAVVQTRSRSGLATATWNEVAVGDPAFDGRYTLRAGRPPNGDKQVAVTSELFAKLGVELGEQVKLVEPAATVTVTGVVDELGEPSGEMFWAFPGALIGPELKASAPPAVYLAGERAVTWADVKALNQKGVIVFSRTVVLDPPPRDAVPFYSKANQPTSGGDFWFVVLLLAVVAVLGGLEVTLLAGAAFAVGARRQARSLGLLAAAGGSRSQVRAVVLAGGLVLGVAGAVVGVVLGLAVAAVARPVLTDVAEADFGRFDVRPLELLAIASLGIVTGLLAAVLPARTAAAQDPVIALTARRGQLRTRRRVPVIGVVLTVVGAGCAAAGSIFAATSATGLNPMTGTMTTLVAVLIAGGAALAQLGLIITSPAIIGLAGRWSRRLPLAARLALRDAARHRGRSAPAMAAVLTAVTGSTALLLYVAAIDARDGEQYTPSWPQLTAGVQLYETEFNPGAGTETYTPLDPDRIIAAVSPKLPPFDAQAVHATVETCMEPGCGFARAIPAPGNECFLDRVDREPTAAQLRRAKDDWRCSREEMAMSGNFSGTPVGGPGVVEALTGSRATAAAERALAGGGVVVFDRSLVNDDGTATFEVVSSGEALKAHNEAREPTARRVTLPAAYLPTREAVVPAIYSPAAARALGLETRPAVLLMRFDRLPTVDEEEAARAALTDAGLETWFSVERGYVSEYGLGLLALVLGAAVITLGSAGIATGLAQADARADHATLAAVGAPPRLRRTLAAAQALTIAGLGTVFGLAAGFVPALALIGAVASLDLVVPWWQLAQVLVVVPALAGGSAWLLTRSRVPLQRRVA